MVIPLEQLSPRVALLVSRSTIGRMPITILDLPGPIY